MAAIETFNQRFGDTMRAMIQTHLCATLERHFGGDLAQGRYTLQLSRTYIEDQLALFKQEVASLEERDLFLPASVEFQAVGDVVDVVFSQVVGPLVSEVLSWLQTSTSDVLERHGGDGDPRAVIVVM
ncbi:hypothetical protein PG996_016058 [Apiospora saccharicola]|uniref:Uncharacterized protein n=1 Tax=Apiospora saccharicola TaxID=335842 RepID=A0ABR1TN05_9PEZI